MGTLASSIASIIKILPMLINPVTLVIGGILLLVGVLTHLYNTNETVKEALDSTWRFLSINIPKYISPIIASVGFLLDVLLGKNVGEAADNYNKAIENAQKQSKSAEEDFRSLGETLQDMFKGFKLQLPGIEGEGIEKIIGNSQEELKKMFKSLSGGASPVNNVTSAIKKMVEAIQSQTRAFAEFTGIFDIFQRQAISGERLLNRMRAQVGAMREWQQAITTLESRNINKNLLEQVRAMGPQAVDQVRALAKMSDIQLEEYNRLFTQRTGIAGEQAEKVVAREAQIETMIENQTININVTSGDARKIANDIVRELRLAGVMP